MYKTLNMNILIKFTVILFLAMNSSCDSAKAAASENETETKSIGSMDTKYENEGYLPGMVKHQAGTKCVYVIIDEKSGLKYDPINIDEEKYMSFKKNEEKVYFKYRALRMMNRCDDAQPVELEDIKKRED